MSSKEMPQRPLARGEYAPSKNTDLRSPCPMINSLANHGYIPRDGRNVHSSELRAAMSEVGLSASLGALFSTPIYLEHWTDQTPAPQGLWAKLKYYVQNPMALVLARIGMRTPGQQDTSGKPVLDLNQMGLPGAVEHDISLTRRDHGQPRSDASGTYDNITLQTDLVDELLQCPVDKSTNVLTMEDLARFRKHRIETQRKVHPKVNYGALQHQLSCGEIALILTVLGDGKSVPCDYARAFLREERLPIKEGWRKRKWWSLGLLELARTGEKVKKLVGITF